VSVIVRALLLWCACCAFVCAGACDNPKAGTPGIDPPSSLPQRGGADAGAAQASSSGTGGGSSSRLDSGGGKATGTTSPSGGSGAGANPNGAFGAAGSGAPVTAAVDAGAAKLSDAGLMSPTDELDAGY
jgi:hypothetical protein